MASKIIPLEPEDKQIFYYFDAKLESRASNDQEALLDMIVCGLGLQFAFTQNQVRKLREGVKLIWRNDNTVAYKYDQLTRIAYEIKDNG